MARPKRTGDEIIALRDWLTANNIDLGRVPIDSPLAVRTADDGSKVIHYEECVLTEDGRKQLDPKNHTRLWVRPATAPCKVQPHPDLAVEGEWENGYSSALEAVETALDSLDSKEHQ